MTYEIDPEKADNYFKGFTAMFPNKTKRFEITRRFLSKNPAFNPSESQYPSRLALAAHWADANATLRPLAYHLYGVNQAAAEFKGQHGIVISRGNPETVMNETMMLMSPLSFYIGKLGSRGVHYEFYNRPANDGKRHRPPYVIPSVGLELEEVRIATTDIGTATMAEPTKPQRVVPFYRAVLVAENDQAMYSQGRAQVEQRSVILGDSDCAAFLGHLSVINPTEALDRLALEVAQAA